MWTRIVTGLSALGIYGWTLENPKRAFNTFYDASNWLTSHILSGDGMVVRMVRNFFNDLLIDQVKGFLLGIAVATLFSIVFWPVRAGGRWAGGKAAALVGRYRDAKEAPEEGADTAEQNPAELEPSDAPDQPPKAEKTPDVWPSS